MAQILDRPRNLSDQFAEAIGGGFGTALGNLPQALMGRKQRKQEDQALKEMGVDLTGVKDPELRKLLVQTGTRKKHEDKQQFATGLETIGRMREIASRRNIGRGSSILGFFPGETAKDRAEFTQLGTSLIPLVAAGVSIRNQKEFEQYKKIITDPSAQLSEIEGALNGLERIFSNKLEDREEGGEKESKKMKFSPENPEHKAKAEQLFKKLKDKNKVRKALQREFEGL